MATHSPAGQALASFDTDLQLGRSEPLAAGLKRVTMEQLEHAARGFFDSEAEFGTAVHQARKSMKRVRALLRLVESELPDNIFEFENHSLRDTARLIGDVRAARAAVEALNVIRELYGDLLAEGTFEELVVRLEHRRGLIELQALEDPRLVGRIVRGLERAHSRYAAWPTDEEARKVYGVGVRDSYESIRPGLGSTYVRGRRKMVRAYTARRPDAFHDWRKRVKDLRHQMEFLAPLWPEVVVGTAMTADRLGLVLGEDHDLAELVSLVGARPDLCPSPRERSLLSALAQQRRAELELAAEILGRRIYAEKPGSLTRRFAEYWGSRQLAISSAPDTLVVY